MSIQEIPVVFVCNGDRLVGIAAVTATPSQVGVIIVVGGPQYRAGSHRQFTLLARELADRGIPSFRFDHRGMGDSEGEDRNFENIDEDIRSAVDAFTSTAGNIPNLVIWGLCDAASAALYYAHLDPRIRGLVLLNPWVHSEEGASRARLKHYYMSRLFQISFWAKLFSGRANLIQSVIDLAESLSATLGREKLKSKTESCAHNPGKLSYIDRMLISLQTFSGNILLILSGNDIVSQQFQQLMKADSRWRDAMISTRVKIIDLIDANHTFSSKRWRDEVCDATCQWLSRFQ